MQKFHLEGTKESQLIMNKFLANFENKLFHKKEKKERKKKQLQLAIEETTVENYSRLQRKYV